MKDNKNCRNICIIISIVFCILSLCVEFIDWSCILSINQFLVDHKDYLQDVLLGFGAGAFIGVITYHISYMSAKDTIVLHILYELMWIHATVFSISDRFPKKDSDKFEVDEFLDYLKDLQNRIDEYKQDYAFAQLSKEFKKEEINNIKIKLNELSNSIMNMRHSYLSHEEVTYSAIMLAKYFNNAKEQICELIQCFEKLTKVKNTYVD